jgi:hypothetical protein
MATKRAGGAVPLGELMKKKVSIKTDTISSMNLLSEAIEQMMHHKDTKLTYGVAPSTTTTTTTTIHVHTHTHLCRLGPTL